MIQEFISLLRSYSTSLFHDWEIQAVIFCLIGLLSEFTGISIVLVYIFFAALLFDFLLGIATALKYKAFSYKNFKKGITKIVFYVFYIILMSWGDRVLHEVFLLPQEKYYLAMWLTASIIFTELLSIIKHCSMLGLPIPSSMFFILSKAKKSFESSVSQNLEYSSPEEYYEGKG